MAGRMISAANAARIQQMHDTCASLGAQCGSAAKLARKAAEQSVFDLIDQIRAAVFEVVPLAECMDCYPHLEDVYPDSGTAIIELNERYWQATYTVNPDGSVTLQTRDAWVEVEEVWQPVTGAPPAPDPEFLPPEEMKAGALQTEPAASPVCTVKALGDRTIELRVAWGKDGHGESFTPATDFDLDNFPTPPVLYYHGYKADGRQAPKPVVIGKTLHRENRADGHYLTAKLNTKPEADAVLGAAAAGRGFVSPGTAAHLIRKDSTGGLLYWPIVEISAWDGAPTRKQAHPQSLAFLKSLYAEAGVPLPAVLHQEAAGDAATGGPTVDAETAGRIIAAVVAAALTSKG